MSDLVRRLRDLAQAKHDDLSIGDEAAARIEELEATLIQVDRGAYQMGLYTGQKTQAARIAEIIEAYRLSADRKFADIIKRGGRGEKNLELAAATAAGMEHAARNIAKRIKTLEKELDEKL